MAIAVQIKSKEGEATQATLRAVALGLTVGAAALVPIVPIAVLVLLLAAAAAVVPILPTAVLVLLLAAAAAVVVPMLALPQEPAAWGGGGGGSFGSVGGHGGGGLDQGGIQVASSTFTTARWAC